MELVNRNHLVVGHFYKSSSPVTGWEKNNIVFRFDGGKDPFISLSGNFKRGSHDSDVESFIELSEEDEEVIILKDFIKNENKKDTMYPIFN